MSGNSIHPEIDSTSFPERLIALRDLNQLRNHFPTYDWQLNFLRELGEDLYQDPIELRTFRSNVARVSVQRPRRRRMILWDEGFFDTLLSAYITAAAAVEGHDKRALTKETTVGMLRDRGTTSIVSRPYRALVLQEVSHSLRHGAPPPAMGLKEVSRNHIANMFRIVRHFCVLHEIGHLAEGSESQQVTTDRNLETIRSIYLDHRFHEMMRMVDSGDPNKHYDRIRRALNDPALEQELRADIYALNLLFEIEFGWIDKGPSESAARDKIAASLLTYEALAMMHYVQSNGVFVDRFVANKLTFEDGGQPNLMITLRNDVRLFLAARLPHQKLSSSGDLVGDKHSNNAFSEMRRSFPPYHKVYLQLCKAAINVISQFDRRGLFIVERKRADRYTVAEVQLLALRNIGWIN